MQVTGDWQSFGRYDYFFEYKARGNTQYSYEEYDWTNVAQVTSVPPHLMNSIYAIRGKLNGSILRKDFIIFELPLRGRWPKVFGSYSFFSRIPIQCTEALRFALGYSTRTYWMAVSFFSFLQNNLAELSRRSELIDISSSLPDIWREAFLTRCRLNEPKYVRLRSSTVLFRLIWQPGRRDPELFPPNVAKPKTWRTSTKLVHCKHTILLKLADQDILHGV